MILGISITLVGLMAACKKDSKCDILYEIVTKKTSCNVQTWPYQSSTLSHKEFLKIIF